MMLLVGLSIVVYSFENCCKDKKNDLVCYSLSPLYEIKKDNRVEMRFFKVLEKQGEILFYRGKTQ